MIIPMLEPCPRCCDPLSPDLLLDTAVHRCLAYEGSVGALYWSMRQGMFAKHSWRLLEAFSVRGPPGLSSPPSTAQKTPNAS